MFVRDLCSTQFTQTVGNSRLGAEFEPEAGLQRTNSQRAEGLQRANNLEETLQKQGLRGLDMTKGG